MNPDPAKLPQPSAPDKKLAVPTGPDTRMSVKEAQDAMAASFPIFESLAWRFFAIARDLEAAEESEEFPLEEPGPDHLRWYTASSALATYYDLLETRERARTAAERTHADLVEAFRDRRGY